MSKYLWTFLCGVLVLATASAQTIPYHGRVLSPDGTPLAGTTLSVPIRSLQLASSADGAFAFTAQAGDTLLLSSVGYVSKSLVLTNGSELLITLEPRMEVLDQAVVMAYGRTTRRLATGNIAKVGGADIMRQPVANPLAALEGLVPGLTVTSTGGLPGSAYKIQLRGQRSLTQGSDPLIVIDGVPYAPNNTTVNQLSSATASVAGQGLSPLSAIDPSTIESIEVLKDADATAIYGSRGANGVILITTRKGQAGITRVGVTMYTGWSRPARLPEMLDTRAYVQLRREALQNDGLLADATTAPDLFLWDSTRDARLADQLLPNAARSSDAQVTLSGGSGSTQFLFSGSYHRETTVFAGTNADRRLSFHSVVQHATAGNRFTIAWVNTGSSETNELPTIDLTQYLILPPNVPELFDSNGQLTWQKNGFPVSNPLSFLKTRYTAESQNLVSNLQLGYRILPGLQLRASLGYNLYRMEEISLSPRAAQNPLTSPTGSAQFANRSIQSWIAEPQLEYTRLWGRGRFTALIGSTFQQSLNEGSTILASGYTNDALLKSVAAAATRTLRNDYSQYRYEAIFGRLGYQWRERVLLNLSGRRDGSSRFGAHHRFGNFGAIGAGWILSEAAFLKKHLKALSFAKLRGSIGRTGNDQIADYQYLESWSAAFAPYSGIAGLVPARLSNANYSWEQNNKREGALELGFWSNQLLLSASYFQERSTSQLVNYALPLQSGFPNIVRNFPALIENKGWELTLGVHPETKGKWKAAFDIQFTRARNELTSFPGLSTSSYAFTYVEGQPLSVVLGYHLLGVDPVTGVYQFEDVDKNGTIDNRDYQVTGNLSPDWYGGLSPQVRFAHFSLDALVSFKKQRGLNETNYPISGFYPGGIYNLPTRFDKHWQHPGDLVLFQRLTTQAGTPAAQAQDLFVLSDGRYSDASYIRLRNLTLTYQLPQRLRTRWHLLETRVAVTAQNLWTWTPYTGGDPETQNLFTLPPLRTVAVQLHLQF